MVIHGPLQPEISYDEDLGPIILSDWFHVDYFDIVENIMHPVLVRHCILYTATFVSPD